MEAVKGFEEGAQPGAVLGMILCSCWIFLVLQTQGLGRVGMSPMSGQPWGGVSGVGRWRSDGQQ